MSPIHQAWPKPSCKAQQKGKEDKADRVRGGKTTSGNGQACSSTSPRGQWKTEKLRKLGANSSVVPPTTLVVKGLMMMMMILALTISSKLHMAENVENLPPVGYFFVCD